MTTEWTAIANTLSRLLWSLPWRTDLIHFYERLGGASSARHRPLSADLGIARCAARCAAGADRAGLWSRGGGGRRLAAGALAVRTRRTTCAPADRAGPSLAGGARIPTRCAANGPRLTLHELLNVGFDVSVVVDVETVGRNRTRRMMELAYNAARLVTRDERLLDTRAEQVYADSQRVLHESTQQSFHLVTVAVLVSGATRDELEHHVAIIRDRLGSTLRLMRVAGAQDQLLRLWSSAPTRQLDLPLKPWNMLSHGVGCCAGSDRLPRRQSHRRHPVGHRCRPSRAVVPRSLPQQPGRTHVHPGQNRLRQDLVFEHGDDAGGLGRAGR